MNPTEAKALRELISAAKDFLKKQDETYRYDEGVHPYAISLRDKIIAAEAALPALAGWEKELKAKAYLDNIDRMETNDPFNR